MKRRKFIALVGSAAATWPIAGHTQESKQGPVLIEWPAIVSRESGAHFLAAFKHELSALGRKEGAPAKTLCVCQNPERSCTEGNLVLLEQTICNFPRTIVASFASLRRNILLPSSALAFLHGQDPEPTSI
jgi:hypothetical protein